MSELVPFGFTTYYTVQTYDIDSHRRMMVAALVKLMQEGAMQDMVQMGLSIWDMEAHQLAWVLLRKHLKIRRLPRVGETISLYTIPTGFEKFFTYRDYHVRSETGEILAESTSQWILIDTAERRMVHIPPFIKEFGKRMPSPETWLPRPQGKFSKFEHADQSLTFRANWHDLDFNGHINNLYYLQWMLEALPDEILENGTIREIDIQFKVEVLWKDEVVSELQVLGDHRFLHRLTRKNDGKDVAFAVSVWE